MRVLVVGGNGFIGSHVVDALLQQSIEVVVFDRSPELFRSPLPNVNYVLGDLNDFLSLENAMSPVIDGVVHVAWKAAPLMSNDNPISDLENLAWSIKLLELCVKKKIGKLVFASSGGTVYGAPMILPIPEDHPTEPICSYGIAKLAIEKYLNLYNRLSGLATIILRIANPYGVRQSPDSVQGVVPVFIGKMIQGKPLTVWGNGSVVRDFLDVRDVARLFVLALKSEVTGVFNVGSGIGTSINELLELLSLHLGVKPQISRQHSRTFDVQTVILDCRKAKSVYSWEPRITLAEGLTEVSHWLKSAGAQSMASHY
jgi:UDP-glucose 4-epimerase